MTNVRHQLKVPVCVGGLSIYNTYSMRDEILSNYRQTMIEERMNHNIQPVRGSGLVNRQPANDQKALPISEEF